MDYNLTAVNARWSVLWYSVKGKKLVEIEFENDLPGALALWHKVKQAKRPLATLRCCNVGFPPPQKYRPFYKPVMRRSSSGGKVRDTVYVEPMYELNIRGIYWCAYCMSMRKFKLQQGANMADGRYVQGKGLYCPVCQVNHHDHHIRKWNPYAIQMQYRLEQPRVRRKNASSPRSRRSRRRT